MKRLLILFALVSVNSFAGYHELFARLACYQPSSKENSSLELWKVDQSQVGTLGDREVGSMSANVMRSDEEIVEALVQQNLFALISMDATLEGPRVLEPQQYTLKKISRGSGRFVFSELESKTTWICWNFQW